MGQARQEKVVKVEEVDEAHEEKQVKPESQDLHMAEELLFGSPRKTSNQGSPAKADKSNVAPTRIALKDMQPPIRQK